MFNDSAASQMEGVSPNNNNNASEARDRDIDREGAVQMDIIIRER